VIILYNGYMEKQTSFLDRLYKGFIQGMGWSFGVTFGFTLISAFVVVMLNQAGGIPVIGGFLARVVEATVAQLNVRTPVMFR
jgi:uncharacterized membrane protein YphA (DoxX/SURF4 family)